MKIRSLRLKNFRQHADVHLNLSGTGSDFVVIVGDNGFGKSNLLSAISWCLYGRESKAGKNLGFGQAPVNWVVAGELGKSEVCEVSAEMRVEVDSTLAVIRRSISYFKSDSGEIVATDNGQLSVQELISETKGYAELPEPKDWIDRHFPERLEPYFLFDGERLDQFFRDENSALVEQAIMQIAQVDRLESVNSRTEIVRNELSRDAARLSRNSAIQEAELKAEAANETYQTRLEEFERHQTIFNQMRAKYLEAESKVTQLASESTERAKAAKNIKLHSELSATLDANWESFPSWATDAMTSVLLKGAANFASGLVSERRQNGTLPPKFQADSLTELLDDGTCVCGRSFADDPEARSHIEELLESFRDLSGSGKYLQELATFCEISKESALTSFDLATDFRDKVSDLLERIKELEDKIPKSKPVDVDLESDPTRQYLMWQDAHHDAYKKLGELETKKRSAEQERDRTQKEFQRQLRLDMEQRKNSDTIEFASKVVSATSQILSDWKRDVRSRVAEAMKREFAPMLPKKRFINEVAIDENFKVSVKVETGDEAKDELSSGERQALAFAFSLGLNSVSGYSLPMVIDTPFGRMGDEMKRNVAKALAGNTKANKESPAQQVIILMTDSEYNSDVASTLQERNPSRYRISNEDGIRARLEEL